MKVHFTTLGCPKNQVDSELMLGMLTEAGHEIAAAAGGRRLPGGQHLRLHRPGARGIGQHHPRAGAAEGARAGAGPHRHRLPHPALRRPRSARRSRRSTRSSGTSELHRIVDLVNQADGRQAWVSAAPPGYLYDAQTPRLLTGRVPYAYVKIAEGCDMGCTFCAIPQFRGRHRSRAARRHRGRGRAGSRGAASRRRSWSRRTRSPTGATCPATATSATCSWRSSDTRDAVDPPDVPPPRPRHRPAHREVAGARAWCRTSTCRSSTATTRSCAPCGAG